MKNKCDDYGIEEINRLRNKIYNLIKLKDKIDNEIKVCNKSISKFKESYIKSNYDLNIIKCEFFDYGWKIPDKENV